jgi:hypothetical protein
MEKITDINPKKEREEEEEVKSKVKPETETTILNNINSYYYLIIFTITNLAS